MRASSAPKIPQADDSRTALIRAFGRSNLGKAGADADGPVLSGAEPTEPFVEILGIRSLSFNSRYINAESLHPFKPVLQHRPVNLAQDILTYVDTQIRRDPKDIFVVR